jgi:hypothetical protein
MESLGAIMMVTALAWPIIGGAVTGFVLGLTRGHSFGGSLIDAVAGGLVGYALVMLAMMTPIGSLPALLTMIITVGLPVIGGFIGVELKSRFA